MKLALAQINFHVGNIKSNVDKIIKAIEEARTLKTDLVVFSELAICGYPPMDLLEQKSFIEASQKGINDILVYTKDMTVIVGAPALNHSNEGRKIYNAAYVLSNGQIQQIVHKTLLPTYDIFDEHRYFETNKSYQIVQIKGQRLALTICEDLWDEQPAHRSFAQSRLYSNAPMKKLIGENPDFIINIAASPFSSSQEKKRSEVLQRNARYYGIPLVYVNQVGANTDIIFDGVSRVVNSLGEVVLQMKRFEEDFQVVSLGKVAKMPALPCDDDVSRIENIHDALILGLSDYFSKSGFSKALLGLSGGIDSALVAALVCQALGSDNVHGLLMPSAFSSQHSVDDAVALAQNLGMTYDIIPIGGVYDAANKQLAPIFKGRDFDVAEENLQARIRGLLLMAYSNKFGHMLLNTSNKSEIAVGYSTLYGDSNGGLSTIGDVYKTDVYALSRFINRNKEIIPENTIIKVPSAELRPNQQDSDSLPPYDVLDKLLFEFVERNQSADDLIQMGFNQADVQKVTRLVNMSEHKRFQFPPILRVSSKAFGQGRRFPIVAKY